MKIHYILILFVLLSCKKKNPEPVTPDPDPNPVETCSTGNKYFEGKYRYSISNDTIEIIFSNNNCPTKNYNTYTVKGLGNALNKHVKVGESYSFPLGNDLFKVSEVISADGKSQPATEYSELNNVAFVRTPNTGHLRVVSGNGKLHTSESMFFKIK